MHKRKDERVVDEGAILYELVDIQKFLMNIAVVWGIGEEQLASAFRIKSAIVKGRYELSTFPPPTGPTVAIQYDHDMLVTMARFAYSFMDSNIIVYTPDILNTLDKVNLEHRFVGCNEPIPYMLFQNTSLEKARGISSMCLSQEKHVKTNCVQYKVHSDLFSEYANSQLEMMTMLRMALQKYLDALLPKKEI
jgi:hypothetical protein